MNYLRILPFYVLGIIVAELLVDSDLHEIHSNAYD